MHIIKEDGRKKKDMNESNNNKKQCNQFKDLKQSKTKEKQNQLSPT